MRKKYLRKLWQIRFKKMLSLEQQSALDYAAMLEDCRKNYKEHGIQVHLEHLRQDEERHVLLVKELMSIVDKKGK